MPGLGYYKSAIRNKIMLIAMIDNWPTNDQNAFGCVMRIRQSSRILHGFYVSMPPPSVYSPNTFTNFSSAFSAKLTGCPPTELF